MSVIGRPKMRVNTRHFLREWVEHLGLTQEAVAERMALALGREGFGRDQLSKMERGETKLHEKHIYAIAEALNLEPGAVFVRPDVYYSQKRSLKLIEGLSETQLQTAIRLIQQAKSA